MGVRQYVFSCGLPGKVSCKSSPHTLYTDTVCCQSEISCVHSTTKARRGFFHISYMLVVSACLKWVRLSGAEAQLNQNLMQNYWHRSHCSRCGRNSPGTIIAGLFSGLFYSIQTSELPIQSSTIFSRR